VCTTLGMLTPEQALELRAAGLSAYNHNLDTSPEFYSKITSSRKYEVGTPHMQVHHRVSGRLLPLVHRQQQCTARPQACVWC
jgi:hypothetical protein